MARITWFVSACISLLVGLLSGSLAVRDFGMRLSEGWPAYHPSPGESIALDLATRTEIDRRQPGILARFAEFIRRALTHAEFTAGHFDPGRMPA